MLAFYWTDLNGKQHIRKTLIAMFVFVSSCYMVSFLDDTFYSGGNVAVQWSQEEGACSVFYAVTPFYLNYALGQACYLVIYTAPSSFTEKVFLTVHLLSPLRRVRCRFSPARFASSV